MTMRDVVAAVLTAAGVASTALGAFLVSTAAGFVTLGLSLAIIGMVLAGGDQGVRE